MYILRGTTLHRASVSVLYEIGSPLEVRVIDEKELLFFISFVIKAVLDPNCLYKKIQDRKKTLCSQPRFARFRVPFFRFRGQQILKWFFSVAVQT